MPDKQLPHTRVRNGIIEYQRAIPEALRCLCRNKAWFIKSTGKRTYRDAQATWARIEVEYDNLIKAAKAALAANGQFKGTAREWWIGQWAERVTVNPFEFGPPGSYMPLPGHTMGRDIPINGTTSCAQKNDVHEVSSAACPTSVVLPLWAADRDQKPKPRSVRNKASKMEALFTFLEKPDNLTKVTEDDLQRYKEHLLKVGGNNVASDHLKDIRSIFAAAKANKKITMDPAKELRVPPRRPKR